MLFANGTSPNILLDNSLYDDNSTIKSRARFNQNEDEMLTKLVEKYGINNWSLIASEMLNRNARQCHERWSNFLSPHLNHGPWSQDEDVLLEEKVLELGNKWVTIQQYFPDRTDTSIKNRWKLLLRRKENGGKRRSSKRNYIENNIIKNNIINEENNSDRKSVV